MNVYECRRWKDFNSWAGARIIAANSEAEAIAYYMEAEETDKPPLEVIIMVGVIAVGNEPRTVYDDDMR